jgi:hypothetical protein
MERATYSIPAFKLKRTLARLSATASSTVPDGNNECLRARLRSYFFQQNTNARFILDVRGWGWL